MTDPLGPVDPEHGVTEDELRTVCADLLESWDSSYLSKDEIALGREDQDPDPVRFRVVLAFAAHAHHLTGTACSLLHQGDHASALPLLRVAYESALTAVWAAESEDAAVALQHRYTTDASKLRNSARQTGWFDELLERVSEPETAEEPPRRAKGEATNFSTLCQALEPHPDWLYTAFRLLSAYAHPSGSVLRMFVPDEADGGVQFTPAEATATDHRGWWHAAAIGLLHAGQAFDRLDPQTPRHRLLAQAGELLGWEEPLRLTDSARQTMSEVRKGRTGISGR